ncbi:Uma2 family endonuclease [Spirulina subsalsa FACHB-351]|uniref:Uma2 family endonuclease n=1 Tax=Spirulina subsalsa FACHB-351 TaxID=234711 RepID=A0ABT3LCP8_9CYAN|nr:Uma2 family endonuclease [Spirulina subsalsa]MCW6038907.1 Uma2 family endonuclease [Spirulina subsalsa FACHB-351]
MMIQAEGMKRYTPEEYLEQEVQSIERNEYINGEVITMTGGMPNHNLIISNLNALLNFALKRQPYFVFVSDQRVWIPERKIYTYPDIFVVEGELLFQEGRRDTVINPVMVGEVLSRSTQGYDRGEKFQAYRTISGFREYVLIDQYSMLVEHFYRRESEQWIFMEYNQPEDVIRFHGVGCEVLLEDLYDKVVFESVRSDR